MLGCVLIQPLLGLMHHERFKKTGRRQVWSYLHLIIGRLALTLGMANGAVGLWMARATDKVKAIYIAAAIAMWCIWMGVGAWHEWHRRRQSAWAQERDLEIENLESEDGQEQGVKNSEEGRARPIDAPIQRLPWSFLGLGRGLARRGP